MALQYTREAVDSVLDLPRLALYPIISLIFGTLLLIATKIYTNIRYRRQLARFALSKPSSQPSRPPAIPYTIPFLGSATAFLSKTPFKFWRSLFSFHPRSTGACTLLLGGQHTHVIYDADAVQALFKARHLSRHKFNMQLWRNSLGVSQEQAQRYYGIGTHGKEYADKHHDHMHNEFLLRTDAVAEINGEFTARLREELDNVRNEEDIGIVQWLWPIMFRASTTAVLGTRLLAIYPDFARDFPAFDRAMLSLFFGIPQILTPEDANARDVAIKGLMEWQEAVQHDTKGHSLNPEAGAGWEPNYGCRFSRARQEWFAETGLSTHTRAASDLGLVFGLASNAIPATGWILLHLFDPKGDSTVLPRIIAEVKTAHNKDGTLDFGVLTGLPLLQSVLNEVLRLYVDVLVTRNNEADLILPFQGGDLTMQFPKNEIIMAPSYLQHHDETFWTTAPVEEFYAERFLRTDPESGKTVFSLSGTAGKFFPWGGGKAMCPGRAFAKQEILGTIAMILLNFDIEELGFMDGGNKETKTFPGVRRGFSGAGVVVMDGDLKVRIRRKSSM